MRLDRLLITAALLGGSVLVAAPAAAVDDFDPPEIQIASPDPQEDIIRGDSVTFNFSCFDQVDPAPSCVATVTGDTTVPVPNPTSGGGWGQAEPGNFTITVTSEDASGNSAELAQQFSVVDAMCDGRVVTVLQGVDGPPTNGPDVILLSSSFIEAIDTGGGNDVICAGALPAVVFGGAGNDRILGGPQADVLFGGAGNDRIEGRGGTDRLEGDEGDDTLLGGDAVDRLEGGAGNDSINGGPARDTCLGQEGTRDIKAQCEVATGFP